MSEIRYIDRASGKVEVEKVYGLFFIKLLYGRHPGYWLSHPVSQWPFFSRLYGILQKMSFSRKKILPFIRKYQIDSSEFLDPIDSFTSFNDFFIRKLKLSARPIAKDSQIVLPADARYLFYPQIHLSDGFLVKGKKFLLPKLLQDEELAKRYEQGSMLIARLCPVDYHRFHFPCECVPSPAKEIPGHLYSVNPLALKRNIEILTQNKRMITHLETERFGTILYIEVGATYVGTITQTYTPGERVLKGAEKGYFAFGGSCLILLFEPWKIQFDQDLVDASARGLEIRGLLGQSLGR